LAGKVRCNLYCFPLPIWGCEGKPLVKKPSYLVGYEGSISELRPKKNVGIGRGLELLYQTLRFQLGVVCLGELPKSEHFLGRKRGHVGRFKMGYFELKNYRAPCKIGLST